MDHGACNVVYIDRRANDEHVRKETLSKSLVARTSTGNVGQSYFALGKTSPREVHDNVEAILSISNEVHICSTGRACLQKITQLIESTRSSIPTFVIIDIPYDEEQRMKRLSREPRTPSPTSSRLNRIDYNEPDDIYAMHLLTHISSEISSRNFSKLVVPVVMLSGLTHDEPSSSGPLPSPGLQLSFSLGDSVRLNRYLDAGAVDVLTSPMSRDRMLGLAVHAYRLQKDFSREEASFLTTKRNRKLSWVGVDDTKPYAYLREAMVSNLMTGICNPETVGDSLESTDFHLDQDRKKMVEYLVGTWAFSAHDLTDDELLYGALVMLKHALQMPELGKWAIAEDEMIIFLLASRTAYNEFVKYHNFRHVVDVLQALFHFLVRIGTLPPYPSDSSSTYTTPAPKSPIAGLLKPFDALTLLISAIGHDVGHPGVNNAFLVALNAPLAQLYNDRSVLESFHCAAYSQILRRYWPRAFADIPMRKLMINNILATDMGLHFKYMSDLGNLQQKVAHDKGAVDTWNSKVQEEQKDLTCGLLIKCADICNVARKFETAAKWANILTDEFSNQGLMEQELEMPSCLFGGPPVREDIIKLGESQIGFMNIFARPLFEAVADILPAMRFAVDEMLINKDIWEKKIHDERHRKRKPKNMTLGLTTPGFSIDPTPSPLSGGSVRPPVRIPLSAIKTISPDEAARRGSTGSIRTTSFDSRRSSSIIDKSSRRSSTTATPAQRAVGSSENAASSRRGSRDPSLTAILVTQTQNADAQKGPTKGPEERSQGDRKDTLTRSSSPKKERDNARPVTAPAHARRNQTLDPYPASEPSSQSHSQVDLSQNANGNIGASKLQHWDSNNKLSAESNVTRSDGSRDSSWWRQMSSRRRTRDGRNGDVDGRAPLKDVMPDSLAPPSTDSPTSSPTCSSPGRKTTTGKIMSFFKRKPSNHREPEKQLSSFGSSSQLRTPQTSDPGRSLNSDD